MSIDYVPDWMTELEEEDVTFIKKLVLSSGSLKDMAAVQAVNISAVIHHFLEEMLTESENNLHFVNLQPLPPADAAFIILCNPHHKPLRADSF